MAQENFSPRTRASQLSINAASGSHTGRVREQNEDTVALCEPPDHTALAHLGRLYLLADGAGGHAAGEVASRTAVETIATHYYEQKAPRDAGESMLPSQGKISHLHGPLLDLDLPAMHMKQAFFSAHTRLLELAALKPEYSGMLTTCVAAVVKGTHLLIAHVGDSRAYLLHAASSSPPVLTHLTTDHSMVTALAQAGAISPEQMQSSPSRHIILRALGERKQTYLGPDITTCLVHAGDRLMLCCDGLWDMLTEEQMAVVVKNSTPQAACNQLIRLANQAGGEDNISVVVLAFS